MNLKGYAKQQGWSDDELTDFMDKHKELEKNRKIFMKQYRKDHEGCPKCGETVYGTTYVGYVYNSEHPEEYKDLNTCTCRCGDRHKFHDRVPFKD